MHEYLIGNLVLAAIFGLLYFLRRDLHKAMVYSGSLYLFLIIPFFFILKLISSNPAKSVTPGYWSPPTLFDIGHKTGGLAIEDLLFTFFASAIAAGLYELVFDVGVATRASKKLKRSHALLTGATVGFAIFAFTPLNAMYFLIIMQFVGAIVLIWQRRDLLMHSMAGGSVFLAFYFGLFSLFNLLFPNFVHDYYHLQNTSHLFLLGIPLEEYLYAFSFGILWAPIYEYEHRVKDNKRRSSKPRSVSLAAAASRR